MSLVTDQIKAAVEHAQQQLADLLSKRQEIDKKIIDWKRAIDSLAVVSEDVETSIPPDLEMPPDFAEKLSVGFTDAIRAILQRARAEMTPTQIRDELVAIGFDLKKYAQPMVPIHNTLKRLANQEEIIPVKDDGGQTTAYRWPRLVERLALEPPPSFGAPNSLANMIARSLATGANAALRGLQRANEQANGGLPPPPRRKK